MPGSIKENRNDPIHLMIVLVRYKNEKRGGLTDK